MKSFSNVLKGKAGEDIAVNYLKNIGYEIICRNFKTDIGEIDIIAAAEGYLIFVEVKLRQDERLGFAAEAVDYKKIKKISQVASQYLEKFKLFDLNIRFDVVEVYSIDKSVNHIINAFDSFLRY